MARGKVAKLQDKSARSRKDARQQVAIAGTCALGDRPEEAVLVTDLAVNGCRLRSNAVGVSRSEAVVLHVGDVGPIAGSLKWTKGGALGVSFDEPLDEAVVERLSDAAAALPGDSPRTRAPIVAANSSIGTIH